MNKFKIFEIIQTIFCGYNEIKIKFNNTKTTRNSPNIWKLNNTLIWGPYKRLKGNKKRKYSDLNENQRENYSTKCLH